MFTFCCSTVFFTRTHLHLMHHPRQCHTLIAAVQHQQLDHPLPLLPHPLLAPLLLHYLLNFLLHLFVAAKTTFPLFHCFDWHLSQQLPIHLFTGDRMTTLGALRHFYQVRHCCSRHRQPILAQLRSLLRHL